MIKVTTMLLMTLCCATTLVAQQGRYTDWWHFGKFAGVHFTPSGPVAFYDSQLLSTEASASISDSLGNLLFYTNGYYIWNKNNQKMPQGDSLHAAFYFNIFQSQQADTFGNSSTNGVVIVPRPHNPSQYYVFSHVNECFDFFCNGGLVYQLVDMNEEGGLGNVVQRNVFIDSAQRKITEKLSACRHANGRDWWLVAREAATANFVKWLATPDSIEGPFVQSIGSVHEWNTGMIGEMCFNKKGDRLGLVNINGLVEVFHFDRCTGDFSNPLTLSASVGTPLAATYFYGCEFAPTRPMFYAGSGDTLYQWDLMDEANIVETVVAVNPKPLQLSNTDTSYAFGQMQLGPDNRIYFKLAPGNSFHLNTMTPDVTALSVINSPNTSGMGCDVQFNVLSHYPRLGWAGLPNLPNYNLGAIYQSPCDTLGLGKPEDTTNVIRVVTSEVNFVLYPNPGFDYFHCTYNVTSSHQAVVEVFDALGRKHTSAAAQHGSTKVPTKALPPGFYTVQLKVNGNLAGVAKWVKVQ